MRYSLISAVPGIAAHKKKVLNSKLEPICYWGPGSPQDDDDNDEEEIKRSGGDSAQICRSTSPELSPQREGLDKNISMEPTLMGNDILNVLLGDDDDEETVKSEQEAIRRHAARMLYWADKATERRGSGSSGSLRSGRSIEKSDSSSSSGRRCQGHK